jgi:hypothetical protein
MPKNQPCCKAPREKAALSPLDKCYDLVSRPTPICHQLVTLLFFEQRDTRSKIMQLREQYALAE